MKKYIIYCIILLLSAVKAGAQDSYNDRVKKYIDQYYLLAVAEQKNAGIPASITLGQGILETEAGTSELMTVANNHFGIKCKNGWVGDTFLHTDDAPNECFKKYSCAADSYRDHSEHLKKNPRYASLFSIPKTDYASWAAGLKRCGYATNPQYAQKLIKIIEDFNLQNYTYAALDSSFKPAGVPLYATIDSTIAYNKQASPSIAIETVADTPKKPVVIADTPAKTTIQTDKSKLKSIADSARKQLVSSDIITPNARLDTVRKMPPSAIRNPDSKYDSGKVVLINGLRAFYALKGEMLLQYAVKYNVRYPHLLEMNDLTDTALPFNMYIYLEKKLSYGTHAKHTVQDGETLLMIAQEEGLQLRRLMTLNYLNHGEEPATGAVLELQAMAARKPDIKFTAQPAHKNNSIVTGSDTASQGNDYIALQKTANGTVIEQPDGSSGHTPYIAGSDYKGDLANKPETNEDTPKEDLSGLKAELDKVVYTDDSKLPQTKPAMPEVKKPVEEAAKPAAKSDSKYYKVKKGDTASSIARKNNITVRQLMKWNEIDADDIRAGQTLRVKE